MLVANFRIACSITEIKVKQVRKSIVYRFSLSQSSDTIALMKTIIT